MLSNWLPVCLEGTSETVSLGCSVLKCSLWHHKGLIPAKEELMREFFVLIDRLLFENTGKIEFCMTETYKWSSREVRAVKNSYSCTLNFRIPSYVCILLWLSGIFSLFCKKEQALFTAALNRNLVQSQFWNIIRHTFTIAMFIWFWINKQFDIYFIKLENQNELKSNTWKGSCTFASILDLLNY